MSKYTEQEENITFSEPILAQKGVKCKVVAVERTQWEVKDKVKWDDESRSLMSEYLGNKYDACKVKVEIVDDSVKTEHEDAKPKLTIDDQFNIEAFPYPKDGTVRQLARQKLYELEGVFGFDPIFKADGVVVAPFVTRNNNKVAPKKDESGNPYKEVKRVLNPDFFNTYFSSVGDPVTPNWIGKEVYCDIKLVHSEQYGSKNEIERYVKAPQV